MSPLKWFLSVYILGGLTFIPLLLALTAAFVYYTSIPINLEEREKREKAKHNDPAELTRPSDEKLVFKTGTDDLEEKFHRKHDSDVAAGWFAVCREYVPGGVNGKPPDKLSPAGEAVANESPSVYQTMYRSIFDRSQKATIEPSKDGANKTVKRPNNVFYVVLRHGHLMLYDDVQQLDVRYVISLDYHDVDLYGGRHEEILPEGELWVKRNAIRLRRKETAPGDKSTSLPFFLFGENLSEKEDFYHALLKNQEGRSDDIPQAEDFDVTHIVGLVQKLHSSEEQLQTRWLNALIGRLFLALYKTPELEAFIRSKLEKKIARVKKPTFITKLSLLKIDTGTAGPFVTNPRLKDLTVNGDCVIEADVEYTGNFRLEVGATARIDLGKRFGAREVDMILAVTVKKMQGHGLARLKPPPSNRIWFTFEKMPTLDMTVEPIVSSRQITYNIILRQIESRIREVIAESLVLPFWDDFPFLRTEGQKYRGGIWKREKAGSTPTEIQIDDPEDEAETGGSGSKTPDTIEMLKKSDRNFSTQSMPLMDDPKRSLSSQKTFASIAEYAPSKKDKRSPAKAPRVLRAPSFPTAVDPKLTANHADTDAGQQDGDSTPKRDSAAAILKDLSTRGTPPGSSSGTPPSEGSLVTAMKDRTSSIGSKGSRESLKASSKRSSTNLSTTPAASQSSRPNTPSLPGDDSAPTALQEDVKQKTLAQQAISMTNAEQRKQAIASATAAAQKWSSNMGWGVLAKKKGRSVAPSSAIGQEHASSAPEAAPTAPMGRGQPLPPPGQPLPKPSKPTMMSSLSNMVPKRKPILPQRSEANGSAEAADTANDASSPKPSPKVAPPLPNRRRRQSSRTTLNPDTDEDDVLVVEAPTESTPSSPAAQRSKSDETRDDFFGHDEGFNTGAVSEDTRKPPTPTRTQDIEVQEPLTAVQSQPPALPQRNQHPMESTPAYELPPSPTSSEQPPDLPPRTPTSTTASDAASALSHASSIKRKPLSRSATMNAVKGEENADADAKAETQNPWADDEDEHRPMSPHASEAVNAERKLRMEEGQVGVEGIMNNRNRSRDTGLSSMNWCLAFTAKETVRKWWDDFEIP